MKISEEMLIGLIVIPFGIYAFISITDLQKADAVQKEQIILLLDIAKETREDVKTIIKEINDGRH